MIKLTKTIPVANITETARQKAIMQIETSRKEKKITSHLDKSTKIETVQNTRKLKLFGKTQTN